MTRAEALAILESGDFDRCVGKPETLEIEFKGESYQLDRESQKFVRGPSLLLRSAV